MHIKNKGVRTMSAFAKIIGYENVKKELRQVADMIKNPDKY